MRPMYDMLRRAANRASYHMPGHKGKAPFDGLAADVYALDTTELPMTDDLYGRPDLYPWLVNVYVPEEHRGKSVCRFMMEQVGLTARNAGLSSLYLYTSHVGLYEKFGWKFVEEVPTFQEKSPIERLYRLEL